MTLVGTFMVSKPRVLLGLHHNPKIYGSKVGKNLNGIRRIWNPPFEVGFMVLLHVMELGFRINPN